jgi:hypothetical protein
MRRRTSHLPLGGPIGKTRRQVFGLAGGRRRAGHSIADLLTVASQLRGASADDGVRSRLPLRGSPGFPPGSLLRRLRLRRTDAVFALYGRIARAVKCDRTVLPLGARDGHNGEVRCKSGAVPPL